METEEVLEVSLSASAEIATVAVGLRRSMETESLFPEPRLRAASV